MTSPYQEFARQARERFLARQQRKASGTGEYAFTLHAQYKMREYGLSEQRIKSVIRNPRRREEGIVPKTIAVMQPPSVKRDAQGKETWMQEIWVMFQLREPQTSKTATLSMLTPKIRIISAWRYPGVSPKRNPIPLEILREIEEESTLEVEGDI